MIYTPMTNRAMQIAYQAHHGQLDANGIPYILHPVHLAEQMDDEISCTVALLHDVVEDTHMTMENLAGEFPGEVIEALQLLTHREGVPYFDYVHAIRENPIAKKVKLADIAHNSDQSRCVGSGVPRKKLDAWKNKYKKALEILQESDR